MRKYSLGVFLNIFNRNKKDWKRQIKFINSLNGVGHIEILIEDTSLTKQDINILKKLLMSYRVILHAPFMDIALLSPHREIAEATISILKKSMAIGIALNAETMTIHAERYPNFWDESQALKKTTAFIKRLSGSSDLPISVENLSYSGNTQIPFPQNRKQIKSLAKAIQPHAGITIDTGHLLKDGENVLEIIDENKNSIYDIHLHDGKKGSAHLALNDGNLNLKNLISILNDIDYKKFVTLETIGEKETRKSWKILKTLTD
ncbi:MAG: sugar phosphate isomerase/epimerase [Candidatus Levybacteria bacterium]|nr:sugar phosphate isomerase/epimerase [Candidatus Levybacteria bacterium]